MFNAQFSMRNEKTDADNIGFFIEVNKTKSRRKA
jgi:hypothetical protein